ncbi:hypothetical protein [Azospirillum sp. TSO35-2]|uniref:hypothetical protein n=1 Tax=Azospirillum sp. TSO35-2 TaxID=716796 RepID=UPI000D61348B|nr:hypothetical protein [Azospirillum sp. TSO35-2]PWC32445.1 hypothetical protein TSO352_17280 [Azospirillum sp. TSO35-2]
MARRRAEPSILLGPILYFRGEQRDRWWLSALFVLDGEVEPDDLRVDGVTLPVPPRHLAAWRRRHVWRFDFAVPRGMRDTDVAYGFPDGPSWSVVIPGRSSYPRIAVLSGSGMNGGASAERDEPALWPELTEQHRSDRYHLMLHTGGQVDGNAVLEASPQLAAWAGARAGRPALAGLAEEMMNAGFERYLRTWSGAAAAQALASIPSVMMWDGHDLGDALAAAWEGHGEADDATRTLRPLVMAARRHVQLFQTGSVPDAPPDSLWGSACGTLAQGFTVGEAGLLALDLWSDRSRGRMLSERSWVLLPDWLNRFAQCRHLILLSGTPLLAPGIGLLDRLGALPGALPGALVPDAVRRRLGGMWPAHRRRADWERMVGVLADFSRRSGCRVTVASGGLAGVAGRGVLRGGGLEMWQLYGPGFAVAPASGWRSRLLGGHLLGARHDHTLPGHRFELPAFADGGRRTLEGRGWLACTFDGKGQLHARWCLPGSPGRHVQAI